VGCLLLFIPVFTQAAASVAIVPLALFWGAPWGRMPHLCFRKDLGALEFGMWPLGLYLQ
jgi:hypothetical protein